ncbi:forkhead box protein M1 [Candoia aspera]|uniref:forkhead box protein M1 n=1 Tax=Candoia aspera TaxID=51853 RepID=UPI002FD84DF8
MTSNGLGSCGLKRDTEKENQTPKQKTLKSEGSPPVATASSTLWHESFPERPPYSYMAMIQFAINSTEKKRMMLKDIYAWIEDHFPYFKHVAKPGWKNSVRHNLSLHDMFVRETSANGKIAFWTIHPEANRYLTLDQVFKQQKRPTLDLRKNVKGGKAEPQASRPRVKPLLPRVSSHLVPALFPMSEPLRLQTPSKLPLPVASGAMQINRGERPAPKILRSSEEPALLPPARSIKEESYCGEGSSSLGPSQPLEEGPCTDSGEPSAGVLRDGFRSWEWASSFLPAWPVKEEPAQGGREQSLCVWAAPVKAKGQAAGLRPAPQSTPAVKRQAPGRSRRKQHLALSSLEEPVLLLPLGGGSPSFLMGHSLPSAQGGPLGSVPHPTCAPGEEGRFETPVQGVSCQLPTASTPNKTPMTTSTPLPAPDRWRSAPLVKERSEVDFSSLRPSPLPFLAFQDGLDLLGFHEAPLRPPLCDSPQRPLLSAEAGEIVPGLLTSSPTPSTVASELPGDNSLLEGLALDTLPDNWSKIALDVSFPDTQNDDLETSLSWSPFLPQLK